MNGFLRKYKFIIIAFLCLNSGLISAQSYAKDSLQIKSYVRVEYRNSYVKDIKLLRVMCDYCSDIQKEAIGEEAIRRAAFECRIPKNRLKDGDKKLAIYIRIAKKDFAAIKEN